MSDKKTGRRKTLIPFSVLPQAMKADYPSSFLLYSVSLYVIFLSASNNLYTPHLSNSFIGLFLQCLIYLFMFISSIYFLPFSRQQQIFIHLTIQSLCIGLFLLCLIYLFLFIVQPLPPSFLTACKSNQGKSLPQKKTWHFLGTPHMTQDCSV